VAVFIDGERLSAKVNTLSERNPGSIRQIALRTTNHQSRPNQKHQGQCYFDGDQQSLRPAPRTTGSARAFFESFGKIAGAMS